MKPTVNLVGSWRSNIKWKVFKLDYEYPELFLQCQWQKRLGVSIPYLIYRILLAVTFTGILVSSLCETGKNETTSNNGIGKYDVTTTGDREATSTETILVVQRDKNMTEEVSTDIGPAFVYKWPIYLTNWGIAVCTAQAIVAAVLVVRKKMTENHLNGDMKNKMPLSYKLYWALHTTASVIAPSITILYWGLVYKAAKGPPSAVGILVHAVNSILMLIDLTLVTHPHRLQHFYFPVMLAFIYSVFTIIYYLAGGTSRNRSHKIYPQLDWSKPFTLAIPTAIGALVLVLILHSLMYGYSVLRCYIGRKLKTPKCFYIGEGSDNRGANLRVHAFDSIDPNSFTSKGMNSPVIIMNDV